ARYRAPTGQPADRPRPIQTAEPAAAAAAGAPGRAAVRSRRRAGGMKKKQQNHIVVPRPARRQFYGHGIPGVQPDELVGKLIVVEGADGSGRSTQIARLVQWLETSGHATVQVGLKRSSLVSEELEEAQNGN